MKQACFCLFIFFFNSMAFSQEMPVSEAYYGTSSENLEQLPDLKNELFYILSSYHIRQKQNHDKIESFCHPDEHPTCYSQVSLGYRSAREYLFGQLYLQQTHSGQYYIQTTYCNDVVTNEELPSNKGLGPMKIPSANVINTEHSWPQSLFSSKYPKSLQKSDLHALFPVHSRVNSTRGNRPFGEVAQETMETCPVAQFGVSENSSEFVFEPSPLSKGNIARAIFYFATRYEMNIDPLQESVLRQWHQLDPVDFDEIARHEAIFELEGIRNPFIDHPEWANLIANF